MYAPGTGEAEKRRKCESLGSDLLVRHNANAVAAVAAAREILLSHPQNIKKGTAPHRTAENNTDTSLINAKRFSITIP